mmetsp:Transcript_69395/g.193118  ORF Transcript_69395/g.193118 Transcript_69395/m.193118 type:complete len:285 (-) Transcript_69395:591-1445(-)
MRIWRHLLRRRPLQNLKCLADFQGSYRICGCGTEALLQFQLPPHAVMIRDRLRENGPSVALKCQPTFHAALYILTPRTCYSSQILEITNHFEGVSASELPDQLRLSDVVYVRYSDRRLTGVQGGAHLSERRPAFVLQRDPTLCVVFAGLDACTNHFGDLLFTRALQKLKDFVLFQGSDNAAFAGITLELALQRYLLLASVEGLLHLTQEGCALVPLHGNPARSAVDDRLHKHAGEPEILVNHRSLQHLEKLLLLCFSEGLTSVDIKHIGERNLLYDNEEVLEET